MHTPYHHAQTNRIPSKFNTERPPLHGFFSHKQNLSPQIKASEEQKFKYQTELKYLIHQWIDFESSLNHQNFLTHQTKNYLSLNTPLEKPQKPNQSSRIYDQIEHPDQVALSKQLIQYICQYHPIFSRINYNLAQTLINIGVFTLYQKGTQIPYIFYEEKNKNHCNSKKKLGIVMYGKLKLYNKIQSFDKIIDENDTIGEHGLQTLTLNFPEYRNIKVKSIDEQTAILWIKKAHYEVLFKESMRCGLKEQLKKFQSHLKLSWIKKSIKKT